MDMAGRIPAKVVTLAVALVAVAGAFGLTAGAASAVTYTPIYNNIPSPLPGNVPSESFEATQTSQFGGQVALGGANLSTTQVKVAMSTWACQSGSWVSGCLTTPGAKFEWPVTLHVYAVGADNSVGTEVARITKTFKMPYRPSANAKCTGEHAGGWLHMGTCFHGKLFTIVFALKGVALPSTAIISVSFNTADYGAEPSHNESGPYNSLNVAGFEGSPTIGSDPQSESDYTDSTWTGAYCDAGLGGTGSFRFDPALPGECLPSQAAYDGFDNEGLQPGFEVLTAG